MTRPTILSMIVEDLGYCCPQFFFSRYTKTALIAARLGVSQRAVRYAREAAREEPPRCEGCEKCLAKRISSK